jgi:hypothetical protein
MPVQYPANYGSISQSARGDGAPLDVLVHTRVESKRQFKKGGQLRVARNFAINLYRSNDFSDMAQAERLCKFGLDTLKTIFRMK